MGIPQYESDDLLFKLREGASIPTLVGRLVSWLVCLSVCRKKSQNQGFKLNSSGLRCHMKYMTKMRQVRKRGRERGGEGRGGGGIKGGAHRVLDHTYPELSVARATLVSFQLVHY